MDFNTTPQAVIYMIRHYLITNITDPLSNESRGYTEHTQYFLTDGEDNQKLYLERKPISSGKFQLFVDNVLKIKNVDYTVDYTKLVVTLNKQTTNKEIKVEYDAVKSWVYDDHPNLNASDFPRITVDEITTSAEPFQVGEYYNYSSGKGNLMKARFKIIIRHRQNLNFYSYGGDKLKNYDLVNAITDSIVRYFKQNKLGSLWKFRTFDVDNIQRITTEEDSGILRKDIDLEVIYFHNGCD